jgi:hypothetical protein
MAYGTINADRLTDSDGSVFSPSSAVFRNRIINGDMRISQRGYSTATSISNATTTYTLDRWAVYEGTGGAITVQQSATAPSGFSNSLAVVVTTANTSVPADSVVQLSQSIEGLNTADLGWGTASAKTITLSFWVRSSNTGTFGGTVRGASTRSYPFSYAISSVNTWEQKTVTIPGDTSGTWEVGTGTGLTLFYSLGCGTDFQGTANQWASANYRTVSGEFQLINVLNATWNITGVQLEVGSVATPFERRDYGRELAMCQRYYYKTALLSAGVIAASAFASTTVGFSAFGSFPVRLRTNPSALETSGTATDYQWNGAQTVTCNAVPTFSTRTSSDMWQANGGVSSGLTAGQGGSFVTPSGNGYMAWSAEL